MKGSVPTMEQESLDKFKFDNRLRRRNGWLSDEESSTYIDALPDVADKAASPEDEVPEVAPPAEPATPAFEALPPAPEVPATPAFTPAPEIPAPATAPEIPEVSTGVATEIPTTGEATDERQADPLSPPPFKEL